MKIFSVVARFFRPRGLPPRSAAAGLFASIALAALFLAGAGVIRLAAQTEAADPSLTPAPSPNLPPPEIVNEVIAAEEAAAPSPAPEPVAGSEPDLPPSPFSAPAESPAATPVASPAATAPPPTLAPSQDVELAPNSAQTATTALEAQPVATANTQEPANTQSRLSVPDPSPAPAPLLRAADVAFPTPSVRNEAEPLVAIGRPVGKTDFGADGNRRAAQLRSMPPERFTFDRALLRDVLRFLGEAAGIPFVSIPENSPQAQQLVTFRMTASPFAALESVARQYRISLKFDDGVWFFTLPDVVTERHRRLQRIEESRQENELVGVMYQLRYDAADRIDFRSELIREGAGQASSAVPQGVTSPNLPLQYSQKVFAHRIPRIVNDVRAILGLPPLLMDEKTGQVTEVGQNENTAGAIVDFDRLAAGARAELEGKEFQTIVAGPGGNTTVEGQPLPNEQRISGLGQPATITPLYVPPEKPQVIYNSDSNFLWVVATRRQHKWVAEYLAKVDKPQDLIAIEVKFLETKKNPQYDFGINWGNTLGTGITVRGSANAGINGAYRFGFDRNKEWGSTNTSASGFDNSSSVLNAISNAIINNQTNLTIVDILNNSSIGSSSSTNTSFDRSLQSQGNRTFNLDFRGQNTTVPYEAVLSMDEVSVTLQAFMQDRDTSIVQYPRVLTLNNREVAITSSENTPLNIGTDTAVSATGTSGQTVGQLGYLPTGTQINILPKVVSNNQIAMTVAITVSSVVGTLPINLGTGVNLYPITSERVYNAALQVNSGYTLAVGGLEKVDDSNVQGGVPFLKDIPGVGYFFKNKNKARNKVNLIIFITPYLISDPARTPGISETPQSIVPQRPGIPPQAPTFTPDGQLSGGEASVGEAFAWLDFQLRYFRQVNIESMMTLDSVGKLRDVIGVARALLAYLQSQSGGVAYSPEGPQDSEVLRAEQLLTDLNRTLAAAQDNLM